MIEGYYPNKMLVSLKDNYISNHDISPFLGPLVDLNMMEVENFASAFIFDINGGIIKFSRNSIDALKLTGLLKCVNFYDLLINQLEILH